MSRSIELSDEDYARLEQAAEQERITPAEWVARRIPNWPEGPRLGPNDEPAKTLADLFEGRIGRFSSGHGQPRIEDLRGEPAGDTVEEAQRAEQVGSNGTSTAKPATMAERLAGRIGRLSGSGGLPSSDDVAKSFAEYLEAKQRAGRL